MLLLIINIKLISNLVSYHCLSGLAVCYFLGRFDFFYHLDLDLDLDTKYNISIKCLTHSQNEKHHKPF